MRSMHNSSSDLFLQPGVAGPTEIMQYARDMSVKPLNMYPTVLLCSHRDKNISWNLKPENMKTAEQATSLRQSWPCFTTPYSVIKHQWANSSYPSPV